MGFDRQRPLPREIDLVTAMMKADAGADGVLGDGRGERSEGRPRDWIGRVGIAGSKVPIGCDLIFETDAEDKLVAPIQRNIVVELVRSDEAVEIGIVAAAEVH